MTGTSIFPPEAQGPPNWEPLRLLFDRSVADGRPFEINALEWMEYEIAADGRRVECYRVKHLNCRVALDADGRRYTRSGGGQLQRRRFWSKRATIAVLRTWTRWEGFD